MWSVLKGALDQLRDDGLMWVEPQQPDSSSRNLLLKYPVSECQEALVASR